MVEISQIVQWIVSALGLIISGLVAVIVKMLWDTIGKVQLEVERQANRINALSVDMAKIGHIFDSLKRIEDFEREHIKLHRFIEEKTEKELIETERLRATYIPRIQVLEEHYKEILSEIKKLVKLNEIVK